MAGSSPVPWDSPPVGLLPAKPESWECCGVGASVGLKIQTRGFSQIFDKIKGSVVACPSLPTSVPSCQPAPTLAPADLCKLSCSSGWDPDVPTWIWSQVHKVRQCLYWGTVFITDVHWIKVTASSYEGVIQTELIIAVSTYKYSCVCPIKKAKQIKYFSSSSIACRSLTRHRSQNNSAGNLVWSGTHFSSTSSIVSNLSGSVQHS